VNAPANANWPRQTNAYPPHVQARVDLIGRITLYGFTLAALCGAGSTLTSLLWLVSEWGRSDAMMGIHRLLLAGFFLFAAIVFVNLMLGYRFLVPARDYLYAPLREARVNVGLTAYNDEIAIRDAVLDFRTVGGIHRLLVVDNNSRDGTARSAREAGADEVVIEMRPGYGSCCQRALAEAVKDADVVVLCEGDMTFCASDLPKLIAYLENCDLVLGTRATQELREQGTQMDWLINPANQVVAKLIQLRFWGTRLTDVGCTYRAIRAEAYQRLAPHLTVTGNHFSPHMFIEALKLNLRVIEIPVTFRKRVGESKGVGSNKLKAAAVALRMLALLYGA
jgi:hypothetical protein